MKKKKRIKARIPTEVVEILRHKGGAHSTKKGARGYNRKRAKQSQHYSDE